MTRRDARVIDGETKLLGLIGHRISHTHSPIMHNRAINDLMLNQVYLPFDVEEHDLKALLDLSWNLGAVGFNVTTPHKEAVARLVPECGLKSANTLYRGDKDWWMAASTDGPGFAEGLLRLNRTLDSFENVVILGAGGVVVSLLRHMEQVHPSLASVAVLSRTDRRQELEPGMPSRWRRCFLELNQERLREQLSGRGQETLLVQATSAPLRGDSLSHLVPALEHFQGVVCDLVYGKPSSLYFSALARNLVAQDGEAMLIEQARLSQKLWWKKAATYDDMAEALRLK